MIVMRCSVCGHDKFDAYADAYVQNPKLTKHALSRAELEVETSFQCQRCKTPFSGIWKGKIVVPVTKQTFPTEIIHQVAKEFMIGWNTRHFGRRCKSTESPATYAGWRDAEQRSQTFKGRPPMEIRQWDKPVGAYLETAEAWEYMTHLSTAS